MNIPYLQVTLIDGSTFNVPIPAHKEARDVILQVRDFGLDAPTGNIGPDKVQAIQVLYREEKKKKAKK